jgi:hypothetical protein
MNKLILLSIAALLSLSACRTYEGFVDDVGALDIPATLPSFESTPESLSYDMHCPAVEVVEELKFYDDFTDDAAPAESRLISRATIGNVNNACQQNVRTNTTDIKITFNGMLGPNGRSTASDKPFFSYPFFVAITAPNGMVLSKEIFAASMTYPPGTNQQTYHENLRLIIPIEKPVHDKRQKILIGFQLTPDQLAYNRERIEAEKKRIAAQNKKLAAQKKQKTPTGELTPVERQPLNAQNRPTR